MGDRLLQLRDVIDKTRLGKSTIRRRVLSGDFPRPLKLSPGCVRWRESDIEAWIVAMASELTASEGPAAKRREAA